MINKEIYSELQKAADGKIVYLIMDGLGGLPNETGLTELETAKTPNMDAIAKEGVAGLIDPIVPGITPGSGPAHLALFGYDPIADNVGRGVLSALGIEFPVKQGDICARINFCTIDKDGIVTDRRAGRPATEITAKLCAKIEREVRMPDGYEFFLKPESEHRAAFIIRGEGLSDQVPDTDPQQTGLKPLIPQAISPEGEKTAELMRSFLEQVKVVLSEETQANMILTRGYAAHGHFPTMKERYGLNAAAIAEYPMYRGLASLVGMDVKPKYTSLTEAVEILGDCYNDFDFFFFHVKKTDSYGEDGNFAAKVKKIEEVDKIVPALSRLNPDVLAITGDHSTPSVMKAHSWHPVPVIMKAKYCRKDLVNSFGETACLNGALGIMPMSSLLTMAMSHAGFLKKFGA